MSNKLIAKKKIFLYIRDLRSTRRRKSKTQESNFDNISSSKS